MITAEKAFEALQAANPAPVKPVPGRASAEEALYSARSAAESAEIELTPSRPRPRLSGPSVAAMAFAAVILLGLVVTLLFADRPEIIDQPTPTSIPTTPSTPTSSVPSTLETSVPPDPVSEQSLGIIEDFASVYSTGDYQALTSVAPGLSFSWQRRSDPPVPWTDEEFEARFEIDAALNTQLSFSDCQQLANDRVSCVVLRSDDLVRALDLQPPGDVRWRLGLDDGAVTTIEEITPDAPRYYHEVRKPFQQWLAVAHPEVENPATDLEGTPWRADTDFAEIAGDLVAEWAMALEDQALED